MKTWVTEVSHLPPVDAPGIPAAAARRAAFVRRIVEAATSRRVKEPWRSAVRCIARPGRKLCGARLHVARVEGGRVEWSCAACGERGLISGFEGTDLDLSAHAPRRKLPQTWLLDDEGLDVLQDATYLPELRAVLARVRGISDSITTRIHRPGTASETPAPAGRQPYISSTVSGRPRQMTRLRQTASGTQPRGPRGIMMETRAVRRKDRQTSSAHAARCAVGDCSAGGGADGQGETVSIA
ncbi:MAG: hypothetical protein IT372_37925 [Polyangiaceae bacterium]|nr:hypothetical protein [Polyangiaceae bacterium]